MTPALVEKIKEFTKRAVDEIAELEDKIAELENKEAEMILQKAAYYKALKMASKAMCDSDWITDDDGSSFMKKAQDNPAYLAKVITKLCEAQDVMTMGSVSKVSSYSEDDKDYDPVKARAFGMKRNSSYSILDDSNS